LRLLLFRLTTPSLNPSLDISRLISARVFSSVLLPSPTVDLPAGAGAAAPAPAGRSTVGLGKSTLEKTRAEISLEISSEGFREGVVNLNRSSR
ncbi:hypothetical protein RA272_28575, partial [Pseudomonas syringae pv. tagetis]|uniref:hypothetical protein n=1 Tax=Pseudomonas syringae group genomosp. 7 TaxID=251699 RepID=UPI00376F57D7